MPIGDPIAPPIPAVGTPGQTYASQLVAFLQEVKARLEANVPLSSILIEALDMANNAIENVQYISLYESLTEPTGPVGSFHVYQGNLWYVSVSGAFALSDGAGLDVTGFGGIAGDYGSPNPAQVRFVDADASYEFWDDYVGNGLAGIKVQRVTLAQPDATDPGSTVLKHYAPITDDREIAIGPIPASGVSLPVLVGLTGDATTDLAEVTRVTNTPKVTDLDATGQLYHGQTREVFDPLGARATAGSVSIATSSVYTGYPCIDIPASSTVWVPFQIPGFRTVSLIRVYMEASSTPTISIAFNGNVNPPLTPGTTWDIGTGKNVMTGTSGSLAWMDFTVPTTDIPAGHDNSPGTFYLKIVTGGAAANIEVYNIEAVYTYAP